MGRRRTIPRYSTKGRNEACACGCTHRLVGKGSYGTDKHNGERKDCRCSHFVSISNWARYQLLSAKAAAEAASSEGQQKIAAELEALAKARKRYEPASKVMRRLYGPLKKKKKEKRNDKAIAVVTDTGRTVQNEEDQLEHLVGLA